MRLKRCDLLQILLHSLNLILDVRVNFLKALLGELVLSAACCIPLILQFLINLLFHLFQLNLLRDTFLLNVYGRYLISELFHVLVQLVLLLDCFLKFLLCLLKLLHLRQTLAFSLENFPIFLCRLSQLLLLFSRRLSDVLGLELVSSLLNFCFDLRDHLFEMGLLLLNLAWDSLCHFNFY